MTQNDDTLKLIQQEIRREKPEATITRINLNEKKIIFIEGDNEFSLDLVLKEDNTILLGETLKNIDNIG